MADVTETRHTPSAAREAPGTIGLVAVFQEGKGDLLPAPRAVRGPCKIGRDPSVAFALDDAQASRHHAEVAADGTGLSVTDLQSRNGTYVDGERVAQPRRPLPVGSTLRCGKTLFRVVADVAAFIDEPVVTSPPLIGGPALAGIRKFVAGIAPLRETVLLEGETGTGKEQVAQALHMASGRRGDYVAINCAAIPTELVEAELFGHRRGAFSGAEAARPGLFRTAQGGTLLLDEIGDLPLAVQAKLLRALDTGEIRPVGEDRALIVDVRALAATNLNLDDLVAEGRFRADLLHRIAAWRIRLPPLRERREDLPALTAHFLPANVAGFAVEAMELMIAWHWPGNVRELRNTVLTAVARAAMDNSNRIHPAHLPPSLGRPVSDVHATVEAPRTDEDALLRVRVETALRLREGNVAQVARDLGYGRAWLYQLLRRFDIDPETYRKRP